MAAKSRYVGFRAEPDVIKKLILLSMETSEPGNMSAGLRHAIDMIEIDGVINARVIDTITPNGRAKGNDVHDPG